MYCHQIIIHIGTWVELHYTIEHQNDNDKRITKVRGGGRFGDPKDLLYIRGSKRYPLYLPQPLVRVVI